MNRGRDVESLFDRLGLARTNPAATAGDGTWRAGVGEFMSEDPATGLPLASIGRAGAADCQAVLDAAAAAFLRWREVPAPRRGLFVRDLADELRRQRDDLGTLVALEVGKIRAEGLGEIQEMIDIADYAVGLSRQIGGLTLPSERPAHRLMEQWHPLGVVGCVTAFNFPAAVWSWNAFIAAVCGDTVVWKPSPKAPLTAIAIHRIVERVAARHDAAGVFSLLLGDDPALAASLAADRRVALFSFTGSSAVGHHLAPLVAARFGRCLLECGGNNAVIVDETADLDLALPAIVFGAVGTAGQRCTTTRRLLVHASRLDEVATRLAHAYARVRIGDPLDPATLMGPLIDAAAVDHFAAAVAEARAAGGRVLVGGERIAGPGHFVAPTLIRAENHWPIVQRETFAPILYLMPWQEFDEAIRMQNAVPQGLSSALFTRDLLRAERFLAASGSDCGIANINAGTSGAEIGGAFGGEKETGGGREAGSDAWKRYMRRQTVVVNRGNTLPLAQGIVFDLPGGKGW
ncbi:MAG: aldehyde dehydrogenase family protein [Betaproteobacteria bacterium]|nr:aldehyde dehydrogenase family protein [Betaproteobacteria bacterium]